MLIDNRTLRVQSVVRASAAVAACALMASICAACTTGPSPTVMPAVPEQTTSGPAATVPSLPIEAYMFTPVELNRADRARMILSKKCMDTFGIEFTIPVLPTVTAAFGIDMRDRRYGVTNKDQAESLGYHPPADLTAKDTQPPMITTMNAIQKLVYFGLPSDQHTYGGHPIDPGGCTAAAAHQIAPVGELAHSELTAKISHDSFQESLTNPQVTAGFGRWAACMHAAGYNYANPLASATDPRWRTAPQPTADEIKTATTDVHCQTQVGLVQIWSAAEGAIQQQQMVANAAELAALKQQKQQQLDVINSVLGG